MWGSRKLWAIIISPFSGYVHFFSQTFDNIRQVKSFGKWNFRCNVKLCLSFLPIYPWDTPSSHSSLILFCPFWFRPGTFAFAIFPTRRRGGFDSVLPTRPDLYEVFLPILPFPLSLSSCPLPTYQPLSAIRRIEDVILRREYVTRGRAKRQTSNQGAWRDGSLLADERQKGGKIFLNLPPNLPASTSFKWFPPCPSFYHRQAWFLKRNLCKFLQHVCYERR